MRQLKKVAFGGSAVSTIMCLFFAVGVAAGQPHPWQPEPDKADLMVIGAHGDDESVFFGGMIPYYAGVLGKNVVQVVMTYDARRISEIQEAAWINGLRNLPIQGTFTDALIYLSNWQLALDFNSDLWLDGRLDKNPAQYAPGRLLAASYLANLIRQYRPDVIITHDLQGEYLHNNHIGTAWAVADAFDLAANAAFDPDGLPPWQVKKLYVHLYNRVPAVPMISQLLEDWSIPYGALDGKTPLAVSDMALDAYVSRGGSAGLLAIHDGKRWSDQWGLYRSLVGPDSLGPDGWAHGGVFENINHDIVIPPEPRLGDFNGDGLVDQADYTTWADNFGADDSAFVPGSRGATGIVSQADYTTWADHYGQTYDPLPQGITVSESATPALASEVVIATNGPVADSVQPSGAAKQPMRTRIRELLRLKMAHRGLR